MMFPDYLDGAKVIEYTERGSYGKTVDPWADEAVEKDIRYVAICRYEGDDSFYVFWCDEHFRVLQDWQWDSVAACKRAHTELAHGVWHRKIFE